MNIPIRQNIEILPPDKEPSYHHPIIITSSGKLRNKNESFRLGWTVTEKIGIAVINPRAISKLKLFKNE